MYFLHKSNDRQIRRMMDQVNYILDDHYYTESLHEISTIYLEYQQKKLCLFLNSADRQTDLS